MHICIYVCMYVYMYICIYVYMYICIYVYMYICIYVYMYSHVCTHVMYIHVSHNANDIYFSLSLYIYIYICVFGYAQTRICMYLPTTHVYMRPCGMLRATWLRRRGAVALRCSATPRCPRSASPRRCGRSRGLGEVEWGLSVAKGWEGRGWGSPIALCFSFFR